MRGGLLQLTIIKDSNTVSKWVLVSEGAGPSITLTDVLYPCMAALLSLLYLFILNVWRWFPASISQQVKSLELSLYDVTESVNFQAGDTERHVRAEQDLAHKAGLT